MLNIPETVKALFKADGIRKNFRVHFPGGELPDITNENIVQESVKFTESLCSQDVLKFGLTEASVIEFETVGVANMYGMTIECGIEIDLSSLSAAEIAEIAAGSWDGVYVSETDTDIGFPFFRVPYGVFTVDRCPRNHEAMTHRKVTAYSATFSNLSAALPMIPSALPTQTLYIDPMAFIAQADTDLLTSLTGTDMAAAMPLCYLYDSTGKSYQLSMSGVSAIRKAFSSTNRLLDFIKASDYDADAALSFGNSVADYLTANGYDLTYNAAKKKIYADNRIALRNAFPMLFGASIYMRSENYVPGSGTSTSYNPIYSYIMAPGTLYPVIYGSDPTSYLFLKSAFVADIKAANLSPISSTAIASYIVAGTGAQSFRLLSTQAGVDVTFSFPKELPDMSSVSFTGYRLTNRSTYRIKIQNTGTLDPVKMAIGSDMITIKEYSFENAFDREELANGCLELSALFGKVDRSGILKTHLLDNSSVVFIMPGQYSQAWWDEFNVNPVGSVIYNYKTAKDEETILYQFGNGSSVYDMSDNAVLKVINVASASDINAVINAALVSNIGTVAFTPIDLEMKGLPYLESGDAVTLTAEDGTTVDSYILRQEISGIQVLTATIESTSGVVFESEVTS